MTTPPRKPVFIEKIFPVTLLNQQVYYEHGGNPFKGLHRWYSRKPLSFSRASVLGSLLPADLTMEEFEDLLGMNPDGKTKLYKTPPGPVRIQKVHDLCEQMWGTRTPTVMDAFAGGGSIPFEAVRYGLRVLASDLNPVAVVTMKAAMEYPLKFGAQLQGDIDYWVKWVGDEAAKRLAPFFPSLPGETVQNYLWAHTVVCPSCESVVPLSPNWWLSKTSNYAGRGQPRKVTSDWYAVRPIPNLAEKRVDFELVKGRKGGTKEKPTIITESGGEYDPDTTTTISRGVGKCPNCGSVIENDVIMQAAKARQIGYQLYAVAYRKGASSLEFRLPEENDLQGVDNAKSKLLSLYQDHTQFIPTEIIPEGKDLDEQIRIFCPTWSEMFNSRQLLTLVTYVGILNEAKEKLLAEMDPDRAAGILTYLAMVMDRCADANCRLVIFNAARACIQKASTQHALNLMWNYPETNGASALWQSCQDEGSNAYPYLCDLLNSSQLPLTLGSDQVISDNIQLNLASSDSLFHIPDKSVDTIVTDPPYYATIQYAELSDFFYCLSPETLIITKRGYIPICDVTTNDFVLDLNGEWTAVQKVGFRDYNGHIFEIQTAYNGQKLVITPGHKVWTLKKEKAGELTGEWIDSSQLEKGDYVFSPTLKTVNQQKPYILSLNDYIDYFVDEDWLYYGKKSQEIITIQKAVKELGTKYQTLKEVAIQLDINYQKVIRINRERNYDHFRIKNKVEIDYDLMKVFGYFLAEGSILKRQSKRQEGRLSFVFNEQEEHYANEILETIWEKFYCKGRIQRRKKEKAIILNFYCEPLAILFGKILGENSTDKKLADWILELPQELLTGLLAGYWNGDGSKGKEFFQATTVSKNLACQIRLILQQQGIVSHLYYDNQVRKTHFNEREVISKPRFLIKIWGKYREKLANILNIETPSVKQGNYLNLWTSEGQWLPIRNVKTYFYTGKVFNLTTESHHYVTAQCCVHNCWQKRILGDIFPDLYATELTDKDREAVANPSRFRNMGISPETLANQDYEAKMENAFREHYRVLRDDGVMTVQFNHKDSGAWDVLAKSLIDAGFEITASWAVSTENPQNLHQAQKNSVSSTVLLVCRKRDTDSPQAWWDDIRPELANLVAQRAPEFEANDITGIDLYLSAFGPALNIFSRSWPVLDSSGNVVRPEQAFTEARRAIAHYRFQKLAQTDTAGFDPLTQWYLLAWDAFRAREFPYDDARQLALAVGGFNVSDLTKTFKLLDSASGTCKLLTPQQRFRKQAFSTRATDFSAHHLVNGLHAIITLYQEEQSIESVRRFMRYTGLVSNDLFMRAIEVALRVIPRIRDERKRLPEEKVLADLWLAIDEIQSKVVCVQPELDLTQDQPPPDLDPTAEDDE